MAFSEFFPPKFETPPPAFSLSSFLPSCGLPIVLRVSSFYSVPNSFFCLPYILANYIVTSDTLSLSLSSPFFSLSRLPPKLPSCDSPPFLWAFPVTSFLPFYTNKLEIGLKFSPFPRNDEFLIFGRCSLLVFLTGPTATEVRGEITFLL